MSRFKLSTNEVNNKKVVNLSLNLNSSIACRLNEREKEYTINNDLVEEIRLIQNQITDKKIIDNNKYIMNAKRLLGQ